VSAEQQLAEELINEIHIDNNIRSLARAITHIDNNTTIGKCIIDKLYKFFNYMPVIGITGSPGVGKSSLINAMLNYYRLENKKVGILAIDPSSPFSGGSILGDRVRMLDQTKNKDVFIRSISIRGNIGGLSKTAYHLLNLYRCFNFDVILLETVGAGQSEVEIMNYCDTTVVVTTAGYGDSIQMLKAGIMEIADIFVVNKSDQSGSLAVKEQILNMLNLIPKEIDWKIPVIMTSTIDESGINELMQKIFDHLAYTKDKYNFQVREEIKLTHFLQENIINHIKSHIENSDDLKELAKLILDGKKVISNIDYTTIIKDL
jgi:LAO/AO transport system kinase